MENATQLMDRPGDSVDVHALASAILRKSIDRQLRGSVELVLEALDDKVINPSTAIEHLTYFEITSLLSGDTPQAY